MKFLIKKIIESPVSLAFAWLLFLFSPLIGVAQAFCIFNKSCHSLNLRIFSLFQIAIILTLFIFIMTILLLWYRNYSSEKPLDRKHIFSLIFIEATSILYGLFIRYLLSLEVIKYANYLYSNFGLKPSILNIVLLIDVVVFCVVTSFLVVTFQFRIKGGGNKIYYQSNTTSLAIYLGLFILLAQSLFPFLQVPELYATVNQTYEQRLGNEFVYVEALMDESRKNSVVILPPQSSQWPLIGNQPTVRYFLFPRTLISGALITSQKFAINIQGAYFVDIPANNNAPAWPQIDKRKKIIIFDLQNSLSYKNITQAGMYKGIEVSRIEF